MGFEPSTFCMASSSAESPDSQQEGGIRASADAIGLPSIRLGLDTI